MLRIGHVSSNGEIVMGGWELGRFNKVTDKLLNQWADGSCVVGARTGRTSSHHTHQRRTHTSPPEPTLAIVGRNYFTEIPAHTMQRSGAVV